MNSRNPSGVCQSPSRVLPEYVEECKVLPWTFHYIQHKCLPSFIARTLEWLAGKTDWQMVEQWYLIMIWEDRQRLMTEDYWVWVDIERWLFIWIEVWIRSERIVASYLKRWNWLHQCERQLWAWHDSKCCHNGQKSIHLNPLIMFPWTYAS